MRTQRTMQRTRMRTLVCALALATGGTMGCGDSGEGAAATPEGSHHITQGGAQDIALFRSIVDRGEVPDPSTLDPVGFFAEHAVDLPDADCGQDVCLHPMLAVAPRFDGSNWTMGFVGMNTPIRPDTLERPPLHLVVVMERAPSLRDVRIAFETGLYAIADSMTPFDRLSLVYYGGTSDVLFHGVAKDDPRIEEALRDRAFTNYGDAPDLYRAIATGAELGALEGFEGATRVLLVTSGRAEQGITDPDRIVAQAADLARAGTSFSVVGAGDAYHGDIVGEIGELGAGTLAYAEDGSDLHQLLAGETSLSLFPLATDFEVEIEAAPGYRVGRIYGARSAEADDATARLASPALFLGHRVGTSSEGGRRGGGGGLFVEFLAEDGSDIGASAPAFLMRARWTDADGREVTTEEVVYNELAPGQNPEPRADGVMMPSFSDPAHGNTFMMLNMYLALRATTVFYESGDCARSLGLVDMMAPTVESWLVDYPSDDIMADFELLLDVQANVDAQCAATPVPPAFFRGSCMSS